MKLLNSFSKIFIYEEKIDGLVVREKDNLEKTLKGKSGYFIISLPDKYFYIKIVQFPSNLSLDQIDDSINLNAGLTLPLPVDQIYFDWEKIKSLRPERQEFFLAMAKKSDIDSYIEILNKAGLAVIAAEPQMLSLIRGISFTGDEPFLILNLDGETLSMAIVENKAMRFLRKIKFVSKNLQEELFRLMNFYNSESETGKKIEKIFTFGLPKNLSNEKFQLEEVKPETPALGVTKRALISRSEDTIVSLMPIGTEEAYSNKKIIAFSEFISNLIVGISLFFILIFGGAYFFLLVLGANVERDINRLGSLSPRIVELEAAARDFNNSITIMNELKNINPNWSKLIREIRKFSFPGITYNRFTAPEINKAFIFQGTALNQQSLLQLKTSLENSPHFTDVKIPLSALTLKQNIGFSFSFILKDTKFLFEN